MEINHISYGLVIYLALIEGLALFFLDLGLYSFFVGFIPMLIALTMYRMDVMQITINKESLEEFPIVIPSVANGIFMMILFAIQAVIPQTATAVLGFISVFLTFLILVFVYNELPYKISMTVKGRKMKIKRISLMFAVYAGLFEAFILPLMMFFYATPPVMNGIISGFAGGIIALFICNLIIEQKPLVLKTA